MTVPPFDRELARYLASVPPVAVLPELDIVRAERRAPGVLDLDDAHLSRDGRVAVRHVTIPGPDGLPLALLVCRPAALADAAPTPLVYRIHGGGMVLGDRTTGMDLALDWVEQLGVTVVSPEYRLAPETPFPGGVEDCYAGLVWAIAHAAEIAIDPDRVIVGGTSAGGGLSAAVALLARERGGPRLLGQLLLSPMLDDRNDSGSAHQMEGRAPWDRGSNERAWTAVLGERREERDVPPAAAPARETDLAGLPPAYLDIGSVETFRDEVVAYASALWAAGGDAELHVWPGGFHGFAPLVRDAAISRDALAAPIAWMRRILDR